MVAGACTEGRGLGKATILMGATGSYAGQLWDAVISPEIDWPERGEREFSVACEIDVDDSALSFHRVMVAPFDRDSHSTPEEYHTWRVSGARAAAKGNAPPTASRRDEWGEQCTPLSYSDSPLSPSQFLTPETLTAAASSSWQLLAENMYRDGHLTTLLNAAESYADRVYEKDDEGKGVPRSTMEDLLTRAASMAVGFHLGAYSGQNLQSWPGDLESEYEGFWTEVRGGEVAYRSVRVGVREAWGLGVGFCGARGAGFGADGVVVVGGEEGPGWEGEGWKGERE